MRLGEQQWACTWSLLSQALPTACWGRSCPFSEPGFPHLKWVVSVGEMEHLTWEGGADLGAGSSPPQVPPRTLWVGVSSLPFCASAHRPAEGRALAWGPRAVGGQSSSPVLHSAASCGAPAACQAWCWALSTQRRAAGEDPGPFLLPVSPPSQRPHVAQSPHFLCLCPHHCHPSGKEL